MKISKRSIKASDEACAVNKECEDVECEEDTCKVTAARTYQSAVDHIFAAIEDLGTVAKDDVLARESIANLSVVLFDLKS